MATTSSTSEWTTVHDERHGFSFLHPPEWQVTAGASGLKLSSGESKLPNGVPEVDIFVQVVPVQGDFPKDYLVDRVYPTSQPSGPERGVKYTERQELNIAGLAAVRAQFRSLGGPTPNWGIEYVVRKGAFILDAYISQPSPHIEGFFEMMISTLRW